jgi:type IV secretion system protein VirB3
VERSVVIHSDPLFVGLTRVPTILGIPYAAFVLEVIAAALINITMGNLLYVIAILPVHGVFYLISAKDPGIFAEVAVWIKTSGRCLNKQFWDGASFSPLSANKWKR